MYVSSTRCIGRECQKYSFRTKSLLRNLIILGAYVLATYFFNRDNLYPYAIFFQAARATFFTLPCAGALHLPWQAVVFNIIRQILGTSSQHLSRSKPGRSYFSGFCDLQHDAGCFGTCNLHLVQLSNGPYKEKIFECCFDWERCCCHLDPQGYVVICYSYDTYLI